MREAKVLVSLNSVPLVPRALGPLWNFPRPRGILFPKGHRNNLLIRAVLKVLLLMGLLKRLMSIRLGIGISVLNLNMGRVLRVNVLSLGLLLECVRRCRE